MGRNNQARCKRRSRFLLVVLVDLAQTLNVSMTEVVTTMLDLGLKTQITIGEILVPGDVEERFHALQRQCNAFQTVRDLHGNHIHRLAAGLLKIGELRDLLTIEPDLPTQAPSAQRWCFPIVLHETNVTDLRIDPQSFQ